MNIHTKSKRSVALFSALCLLLISIFSVTSAAADYKPGRYTTYEAMNFRTGPSVDYAVILVIPPYTTVEVTEISGSFGKLTYSGKTGWMSLDYSTFISDKQTGEPDPVKDPPGTWTVADFSVWNGYINWNNLKQDGVEGVILRIGGRGYGEEKALYTDSAFPTYYKRAKAANLHVGVYFFSYALNEEMAREEAEFTISLLQKNDCELDMPVFIDMEDASDDTQHFDAGRDVCTGVIDTFCSVIEEAGYYPGVYSGKWFTEQLIDPAVFENRAVWMAHYGVPECGYKAYPIDMWQYTGSGYLPSVDGSVDLSKCYVDFPAIIKEGQSTPKPVEPKPVEPTPEDPTDFGEHVAEKKWTVVSEASCTKTGLREKKCKDCGITLLREVTPQLAHEKSEEMLLLLSYLHKPGDTLTPDEIIRLHPKSDPNYELIYEPGYKITGGIKLTYCVNCKKIMTAEYSVPLCTHNSPKNTQTPATCVKDGYKMTSCSECGNYIRGSIIPAAKHSTGDPVDTPPTCKAGGLRVTSCKVCGEELSRQYLPQLDHSFVLSQTVKQATLSDGGEELYVCSACGKEDRRYPGALVLGDITNNGAIDAEDARIALRVSVQLEQPTASGVIAGDTDNDGRITAADARNILRVAVGLNTSDQLKARYYGET